MRLSAEVNTHPSSNPNESDHQNIDAAVEEVEHPRIPRLL
jgi:hypothetical protein